MGRLKIFVLFCVALLAVVGCKKDDPASEYEIRETYFYVKYRVSYSKPYGSEKLATVTFTNAEGKEETHEVERAEYTIGPVYAGFEAKLQIINPTGSSISGSIDIARNSDWACFWEYASFSNQKREETISYKILPTTGL